MRDTRTMQTSHSRHIYDQRLGIRLLHLDALDDALDELEGLIPNLEPVSSWFEVNYFGTCL